MSPSFALLERFTFTGLAKLPPLWAIAAAGGFVLLLYILRLRRRQVEVPFSRLWARVLQDREPTSFWRRLKRLLSMLLQQWSDAAIILVIVLFDVIGEDLDGGPSAQEVTDASGHLDVKSVRTGTRAERDHQNPVTGFSDIQDSGQANQCRTSVCVSYNWDQ